MEWSDGNSPHSFAYDNHVLLQLVNSTVEDVSAKEGLSYDRVVGRYAADQIRKTELQRLKKELSKEKYQELHGSFRAFRKNAKDLNKEERKSLRRFFAYSPCAKQAYEFREELTAIFDMNLSGKQAQSKILRWIRQVKK